MKSNRNRSFQAGFSIIELMVSLVIASFVILAVVGIYGTSREAYTSQDEVSKLHENIRIGMGLIERTMRQGNYKRIPITRDQNLLLVQAFSFAPVDGADGTATTPGSNDVLEMRYNGNSRYPPLPAPADAADGTIVDCAGQSIAGDERANNRFRVQLVAGRPWFGCERPGHPTGSAFIPMIPDVEGFEVLYGIYSDESRTASNFVPWSAAIDPMRVVSVRLHLLFRSGTEVAAAPSSRTYPLAERTYGPFTDRFLRTAVETTIVIRSSAM